LTLAPVLDLGIVELGAGMWAVQGILAALYERQRTGKGRLVECSLLETPIGFSSWTSAQWLTDHEEPTRQSSRHRQNAPYQRMQPKDGYLMVGAAGEAIWARCAKALGHPEWCEDPRFATNQARMANRDALEAAMNAVLTTKTTNDWVEVLEAVCRAARSMITRRCSPTRRCTTAASCNMQAIRIGRSRAHPQSRSATACGCAISCTSSDSIMPGFSAASGVPRAGPPDRRKTPAAQLGMQRSAVPETDGGGGRACSAGRIANA
jgi:hypothetical protein